MRKVHNALDDKGFKLRPDLRQEYNKSSNPKAFTYCKSWRILKGEYINKNPTCFLLIGGFYAELLRNTTFSLRKYFSGVLLICTNSRLLLYGK